MDHVGYLWYHRMMNCQDYPRRPSALAVDESNDCSVTQRRGRGSRCRAAAPSRGRMRQRLDVAGPKKGLQSVKLLANCVCTSARCRGTDTPTSVKSPHQSSASPEPLFRLSEDATMADERCELRRGVVLSCVSALYTPTPADTDV